MNSVERLSDRILNLLNRLHEAKNNDCVSDKEFSVLITLVGDLYSKLISQNKVNEQDIEEVENLISGIDKRYFTKEHQDLDRASKVFLESTYVANLNRPKYNMPNMDYSKVLK